MPSLSGVRVVRVLDRVIAERGAAPDEITLDNGPELTSRALDQWAYARGVGLRFIQPGKPVQNCFVESFNGRLRRVPERALVPEPSARAADHRRMEDRLQSRPSAQLVGQAHPFSGAGQSDRAG